MPDLEDIFRELDAYMPTATESLSGPYNPEVDGHVVDSVDALFSLLSRWRRLLGDVAITATISGDGFVIATDSETASKAIANIVRENGRHAIRVTGPEHHRRRRRPRSRFARTEVV